jgi:membrane-associated phospholipid phosphatase
MIAWPLLSSLGGLGIMVPLAIAVAVWLALAHCRRLAALWVLLLGALALAVVLTKVAFLGWGIGIEALAMAGISGHAARAAAVFPVAAYLLLNGKSPRARAVAVLGGALLACAVAVARVADGSHSPAEALLGAVAGLCVAALFLARMRRARDAHPSARVVAASALLLVLQPALAPVNAEQWITAAALLASRHDRVYQRATWAPDTMPYRAPCEPARVRLRYACW